MQGNDAIAGEASYEGARQVFNGAVDRQPAPDMRAIRKLQGKTALITGEQGSVCLAMARRFEEEGAYVFIMHPDDPEFARETQGTGKNVTWLQGEVFKPDDLRQLFTQIREKRGKIDIMVVTSSTPDEYVPFSKITQEHYEAVFGHPVKGVLFAIEKVLPLLSDGTSIIFNMAIASARKFAGNSLHSATIEAVLSFARALTKQLEDRWIRVNAVSSGTALHVQRVHGKTVQQESLHSACQLDIPITPDYVAAMVVSFLCDDKTGLTGSELSLEAGVPRLRMLSDGSQTGALESASPNKSADAVLFLASEESRRITGMQLFLNGGMAPL